jgi:hypothetical protein
MKSEGGCKYIYIYERKRERDGDREEESLEDEIVGLRKCHKSSKSVVGTQLGSIFSPVFGVATQLALMALLAFFLSLFSKILVSFSFFGKFCGMRHTFLPLN